MSTPHDHGIDAHAVNRRRLAIAFGITATILVAEVIGAIATNSLALLVDAAHMLTDAGGLATALVAANLARRPTTAKRTWGFARAEVLSATAQAAVLLAVGLFVLIEGVQRLFAPPEIASGGLLVFGIIGLVGNIASILVLASGRNANFNLRAAFLEVLNDALGSVAVIIAAIIIAVTGWGGADAIAGLLIGVLILPRAFKLLRETVNVLLESTPTGLNLDDVRTHLLEREHVIDVHDLHASQIATGLPVLTAHVSIDSACFTDGSVPALLDDLQRCVAEHFEVSVEHSTFQLEPAGHSQHEHTPHV
ncbi:cation diffusion facilitator family transporter [Curtobacterium pusillum]|jgi:cobalt-zinc-cadmium efflux system protein|uniref:Cation transporter n=1 Tax=Curtobacterium pusillum TaxID=69373 RepID=A0AAW3TBY6_9MICO|nr:cation diffusion facilitator family transporter [Curtobacterium pusillum]MBA8992179.1 cobalt-zinc-cadmium efflux system protein [Curtobacterium pusillum]NUU12321.1 cation transporter [Curtobacterium pusillum]GLK32356.1 cation transporter [Curtobacterium pusillum]